MVDGNAIAYNVARTLFLLEFGDHTAIVARRTGIPDTVIASLAYSRRRMGRGRQASTPLALPLTWPANQWASPSQLVVVVASLAQGRSSLVVGNIIGSAISNILGAFSLGFLFRPKGKPVQFDRSSRIYSLFLLIVTTFVTPITHFSRRIIWPVCGAILIALFAAYVVSIGSAISKGKLTAPEDSDSDSSDGENDAASTRTSVTRKEQANRDPDVELRQRGGGAEAVAHLSQRANRRRRNLGYHIGYLVLGFLAICLAGYVLSHAAINVTDAIGVSDVLFGVVILAIATTLPEKFVAVLSGNRGHIGILVANTVGSNVFLLSLCLGIIMVDTSGELNGYPRAGNTLGLNACVHVNCLGRR